MESIAVLVLPNTTFIPVGDFDYIGVDKGAYVAFLNGKKCEFCIGDFDSCDDEEIEKIKENCEDVIFLNKEKDDTDSEAAIKECLNRGYEEIWMLDELGVRIDHGIVNLRLVNKYPLKVFLINNNNRIFSLGEGNYSIAKSNYKYFSIFTDEDSIVSLDGVKYPLKEKEIKNTDLFTVSNEILEDEAYISIIKGKVLIIQSDEKKSSK